MLRNSLHPISTGIMDKIPTTRIEETRDIEEARASCTAPTREPSTGRREKRTTSLGTRHWGGADSKRLGASGADRVSSPGHIRSVTRSVNRILCGAGSAENPPLHELRRAPPVASAWRIHSRASSWSGADASHVDRAQRSTALA